MISESTNGRTAKYIGEARNLATVLEHVDAWIGITPAIGLNIPLFRGQEN